MGKRRNRDDRIRNKKVKFSIVSITSQFFPEILRKEKKIFSKEYPISSALRFPSSTLPSTSRPLTSTYKYNLFHSFIGYLNHSLLFCLL